MSITTSFRGLDSNQRVAPPVTVRHLRPDLATSALMDMGATYLIVPIVYLPESLKFLKFPVTKPNMFEFIHISQPIKFLSLLFG